MNRKELLLLLTLAAINFTNIMDFMIMMPLGPQLMRMFQINPQQFGWWCRVIRLVRDFRAFVPPFLLIDLAEKVSYSFYIQDFYWVH